MCMHVYMYLFNMYMCIYVYVCMFGCMHNADVVEDVCLCAHGLTPGFRVYWDVGYASFRLVGPLSTKCCFRVPNSDTPVDL